MKKLQLLLIPLLLLQLCTYARIRLPRLISDGMVLQRGQEIKVWGWAAAGEKVSLRFRQKEYHTTADNNGNWTIQLPPQSAGGPYDMTLTGSNTIELHNILVGDVWLCSGQSNMELTMQRVQDRYAAIIFGKGNPMIRQFTVPDKYDFNKPHNDLEAGEWQEATPEHIFTFSAVAYFFAKEIYEKYRVPVGLINSALGGSPVEAWLSEDALKAFPVPYAEARKFRSEALIDSIVQADSIAAASWYARLNEQDQGLKEHWSAAALDDTSWQQVPVPGYWADQALGRTNGAVWFRKKVSVPGAFIDKPVRLWLGRIVDADSVFVNGQFVGTTGYQYPPRRYELPPGILEAGANTIAVRVVNTAGRGGFVPDKLYAIATGTDTLHLEGNWQYRLGTSMEPLRGSTFIRWKPMGLYNAMIAPLLHYAIKGCIWYQGEANTGRAQEYTGLFKTMISDWRNKWKQGNFPFLFVQLPGFMEPVAAPAESQWAALRQAQLNTQQQVPRTGMAVAIDLGEWNDIHPLNKQDVGHRLALQAMRLAYGDKNVVASGPLYKSMQVKGNKVILSFADNGSPLTTQNGDALKYFAIAGPDRQFVWAQAGITGKYEVTVWSDRIAQPVAVRYAWANNPEGANLYNQAGLPASPFEAAIDR